jgi:hypothetical protein
MNAFSGILQFQCDNKFEELNLGQNALNLRPSFETLMNMEFLFTAKMHLESLRLAYEELNLSRDDDGFVPDGNASRMITLVAKGMYDFMGSNVYKAVSSPLESGCFSNDESAEEELGVVRLAKILKIPSTLRCLHLE